MSTQQEPLTYHTINPDTPECLKVTQQVADLLVGQGVPIAVQAGAYIRLLRATIKTLLMASPGEALMVNAAVLRFFLRLIEEPIEAAEFLQILERGALKGLTPDSLAAEPKLKM